MQHTHDSDGAVGGLIEPLPFFILILADRGALRSPAAGSEKLILALLLC